MSHRQFAEGRSLGRRLGLAGAFLASIVVAVVLALDLGVTLAPVTAVSSTQPRQASVVGAVAPAPSHRLVGIGASGAWWSDPAYALGASDRRRIGQLLYGAHGLALSQFRFNIGGGGVGVTTWWKAPPTWYQPDGTLNFAAASQAVYFLRQAAKARVHDLVGFVNSAPPAFTSNHQSCGGTLLSSGIAGYALELAETVRGIRSHFGVELSYVSPMNEPVGSQASCHQEGMAVPIDERGPLVVALATDLRHLAPWCHVIADESAFVADGFLTDTSKWLSYPGASKAVVALTFHGYDYPDAATLHKVHQLAVRLHHQVWASEICCHTPNGFAYQYDPTMISGIWLADTIYDDLMVAGASAFDWWLALSPDLGCDPVSDPTCFGDINALGRNDGLIYFDLNGRANGDRRLYLTKRYWVLANFSRYLRPGAQLYQVATSDARMKALVAREGDEVVVVAINRTPQGAPPIPLVLEFPSRFPRLVPEYSVETSFNTNLKPVANPTVTGSIVATLSQPFSVTTYVFKRLSK
ncbi:glycoside hydrolase [Ferrimicrobium sp.]|uniref:glycoside hydrolase n=1 Tax=Ferrimicrobium sp. TaxID=2926050 RepID=UPI00262DD493|nr:glycoside hydrolase [Ferrimicrobium sp.]